MYVLYYICNHVHEYVCTYVHRIVILCVIILLVQTSTDHTSFTQGVGDGDCKPRYSPVWPVWVREDDCDQGCC